MAMINVLKCMDLMVCCALGTSLRTILKLPMNVDFAQHRPNHFFLERYSEAYRLELTHFVNAVATGSTLSPDITDGLRAQILADCAAESLSTGRAITIT